MSRFQYQRFEPAAGKEMPASIGVLSRQKGNYSDEVEFKTALGRVQD